MPERQSGITTEQMRTAPKDAVFVWPAQGSIPYAKALANHLGRNDLHFLCLRSDPNSIRGTGRAIILDHACYWAVHGGADADAWIRAKHYFPQEFSRARN